MGSLIKARLLAARLKVASFYKEHTLAANACVGFTVFSIGDGIAQALERMAEEKKLSGSSTSNSRAWDPKRTLTMGCLGLVQNGIFMHYWYRALDRIVSPRVDTVSVLKKIVCDELVFGPQLAVSYLSVSALYSSGGDFAAAEANVRAKLFETWTTDLKLWPIANFIGFSFVPIHIRPTYASGVQIFWQTYLSTVGFRENKDKEDEDEEEEEASPVASLSPA